MCGQKGGFVGFCIHLVHESVISGFQALRQTDSGARAHNRIVPSDLRTDSLTTMPLSPRKDRQPVGPRQGDPRLSGRPIWQGASGETRTCDRWDLVDHRVQVRAYGGDAVPSDPALKSKWRLVRALHGYPWPDEGLKVRDHLVVDGLYDPCTKDKHKATIQTLAYHWRHFLAFILTASPCR
ncbi:hypothetical protein PoB_002553000 [Plakobranchus ocellatus]|uniref:Uncharacterized protein n=1 Tax=Plakobranchus ocellatus TaxID=259542 RepID=A0AAV3ZWL3_9GAST|nr:hypothetical protein PoB_002553000 [Plakobranchus ocellatus]